MKSKKTPNKGQTSFWNRLLGALRLGKKKEKHEAGKNMAHAPAKKAAGKKVKKIRKGRGRKKTAARKKNNTNFRTAKSLKFKNTARRKKNPSPRKEKKIPVLETPLLERSPQKPPLAAAPKAEPPVQISEEEDEIPIPNNILPPTEETKEICTPDKESTGLVHKIIEERTRGKIDDKKLRELESRIDNLVSKYNIHPSEIEKEVAEIDTKKLLGSYDKLVSLLELEYRTKLAESTSAPDFGTSTIKEFTKEGISKSIKNEVRGVAINLKKHRIITDFDRLFSLITSEGRVRLDIAAKKLEMDKGAVLNCAEVLEDDCLVNIVYPTIGDPFIVLKDYVAPKKSTVKQAVPQPTPAKNSDVQKQETTKEQPQKNTQKIKKSAEGKKVMKNG